MTKQQYLAIKTLGFIAPLKITILKDSFLKILYIFFIILLKSSISFAYDADVNDPLRIPQFYISRSFSPNYTHSSYNKKISGQSIFYTLGTELPYSSFLNAGFDFDYFPKLAGNDEVFFIGINIFGKIFVEPIAGLSFYIKPKVGLFSDFGATPSSNNDGGYEKPEHMGLVSFGPTLQISAGADYFFNRWIGIFAEYGIRENIFKYKELSSKEEKRSVTVIMSFITFGLKTTL